ncbi:tetratricopeptide repeat protein [Neorhizobium alkalisoli]|uniref:TPR repeat protein n=1 Tax=Neorhizobium alkalisoli TaxID=528178 RepID=A0A561QR75_9HYPH|nr:tetratricopeptide repeat protein [Neorhizobium alkalisoli]TWF52776.1 TPR repeat protein [Neorhizobium alkalisoli]
MKLVFAIPLLLLATGACAQAPLPRNDVELAWEWFNAAETYRNYKVKGPDDLKISAHYFRLAANIGNASAAYKLGEAYENGVGVRQDKVAALEWYRQSAAKGDKYAELRVGWFYHKGITLPVDPAIAAQWYRLAAEKDNIWAYHMLAFMLMDGEGVPQDLSLAQRYFEKSLPQTNDHWAKLKLSVLLKTSDPKRSQALLREAAASGNPDALKELAQP